MRTDPDEPAETVITYREASNLCDPDTLDRVLGHGRHFNHGACDEPCWFGSDFEELIELVAVERKGGLA